MYCVGEKRSAHAETPDRKRMLDPAVSTKPENQLHFLRLSIAVTDADFEGMNLVAAVTNGHRASTVCD
jgi:hypothetical protein